MAPTSFSKSSDFYRKIVVLLLLVRIKVLNFIGKSLNLTCHLDGTFVKGFHLINCSKENGIRRVKNVRQLP